MTMSERLADLASLINVEHAAAENAMRRGLEHALKAGALLLEAKAELKHGEWAAWLEQHCPALSSRSARVYQSLARRRAELVDENGSAAVLTIREAIAALREADEAAHAGVVRLSDVAAPRAVQVNVVEHERIVSSVSYQSEPSPILTLRPPSVAYQPVQALTGGDLIAAQQADDAKAVFDALMRISYRRGVPVERVVSVILNHKSVRDEVEKALGFAEAIKEALMSRALTHT